MTSLQEIRVNGIGNGFTVLDSEDGIRKDGRLWFGMCSECGEMVTNSHLDGIWKHELVLEEKRYASGVIAYRHSKSVDYCPGI